MHFAILWLLWCLVLLHKLHLVWSCGSLHVHLHVLDFTRWHRGLYINMRLFLDADKLFDAIGRWMEVRRRLEHRDWLFGIVVEWMGLLFGWAKVTEIVGEFTGQVGRAVDLMHEVRHVLFAKLHLC